MGKKLFVGGLPYEMNDAADKPAKPEPITIIFFANEFCCLISPDLFFQQFTGKMDAAFDCSQWFIHYISYFMVLISFKIQPEWTLKDLRKTVYLFINIL